MKNIIEFLILIIVVYLLNEYDFIKIFWMSYTSAFNNWRIL